MQRHGFQLVHGGIRHLEIFHPRFAGITSVHGGIRHLEIKLS
ncbi:MAG: hypothetical protein ACRCVQ_07440 [Acinetobacter ursingii]|nr:hypothetical protein URS_2201 [Acinetobacter ursingii]